MNRLIKTLLIFSIVASNAYADTGAINISQGTPAPYDGVLLTKDKAKVIYGELVDYDKLKLINQSLEDSIKLYQDNEVTYLKEITEIRDQNNELNSALEKASSNSFWSKALWFAAGALVVGFTAYELRK